jgi:hypothetical protein
MKIGTKTTKSVMPKGPREGEPRKADKRPAMVESYQGTGIVYIRIATSFMAKVPLIFVANESETDSNFFFVLRSYLLRRPRIRTYLFSKEFFHQYQIPAAKVV